MNRNPLSAGDNPYQSPQDYGQGGPIAFSSGSELKVSVVERSYLYRHIQFSGQIEAELEWNARWPIEFVCVNGVKVASKHAIFSCVPHFEFDLQTTSKSLAVSVDVRMSRIWLVVVKAFRILVDDRIVYADGRW